MLNILQQMTKSPPPAKTEKARQQTIQSAFSRMAARNSSNNTLTPPSLTMSSSVTEGSSEPTDESVTSDDQTNAFNSIDRDASRLKRNAMTSKEVQSAQNHNAENGSHAESGQTLVDEDIHASDQLLRETFRVLDDCWELSSMPGDNLKLAAPIEPKAKRRESTRLDILRRASSVVGKTKSVLGKRGREKMDAGIDKIQALAGPKRSSLRPRGTQIPSFEGPLKKRPRFPEVDLKKIVSPPPAARRKPVKRQNKQWLSQGLYIGQDRDFDAGLTESQNKLKKTSGKQNTEPRRASSIMPLPMFAGQRTIELGRPFKVPFDIFSPLPPGQPKPDEWKKTRKSMDFHKCIYLRYINGLQMSLWAMQ